MSARRAGIITIQTSSITFPHRIFRDKVCNPRGPEGN